MKINISIQKRHMVIVMAFLLVVFAVLAVRAYQTSNPPVLGHTASEIDPGVFGSGDGAQHFVFRNPVEIKKVQGDAVTDPQLTLGVPSSDTDHPYTEKHQDRQG